MYVIFPAANGENNRTSSLRFAASTGEVSYVRENVQLPERKLMLNLSWMRRYEKIYIYTFWDLHEFSKGWLFSKIHHLEWAESAENWFSPPYQQVQVVNLGNRIPIIYCLFITYYGPPPSINNQIFCNYNHYGYIIRFRGKKTTNWGSTHNCRRSKRSRNPDWWFWWRHIHSPWSCQRQLLSLPGYQG